jgi:hypothetical protein
MPEDTGTGLVLRNLSNTTNTAGTRNNVSIVERIIPPMIE